MMRHYCSYLDHNYVPQLIVLADSLRRHSRGGFRLHVLCLSALCARMLADLAVPEIAPMRLEALEAHYPALAAVKPTRSTLEYYFTLTPFLPSYCLELDPALDEITYLDADLCFFADPEAIFDVIGPRSIGIVPHNLSAAWRGAAEYGRFNVGWITYRRTEQGLRCLADYRRDCLEWCFDRLEGERFADQKYLDRWPDSYADLAVVALKGVNVALYNVDAYRIDERDGRLWCDDEPLIFYHFHGVYLEREREFVVFPIEHGKAEATVLRRIYRPYLARLIEARQALLRRFPEFAATGTLERLSSAEAARATDLSSWHSDALARLRLARALDLRAALQAGTWPDAPASHHFMGFADVLLQAAAGSGRLSVLDWGGGFGELAGCARALWPTLALDWHVRELGLVCDHGRAVFGDIAFHDDDADAFARRYDVALAIGALHYVVGWAAVVTQLAAAAERFLVLADLPMTPGTASLFIQEHPLGFLPEIAFAGGVVPVPTLLQTLAAAGWELDRELPSSFAQPDLGGAAEVTYRTLVFRRIG